MVKKSGLHLGAIGERTFIVDVTHFIDFMDGGMPPVLSTPALIWFLEQAVWEVGRIQSGIDHRLNPFQFRCILGFPGITFSRIYMEFEFIEIVTCSQSLRYASS